ncbi:MAG: type II secretion system protein [Patescibacteria group bacterium]|jgi:prepilin-type N-terminal cleavage/methylation domain-containing protein
MKKSTNQNSGFTLIELLIVIAIIGILTAIGLIVLSNSRERARDIKRKTDLNSVKLGLELYFDSFNAYPSQDTFLGFSNATGAGNLVYDSLVGNAKFISSLPQTPLAGELYYYRSCVPAGQTGYTDYTLYSRLEQPTVPGNFWIISKSKATSQEVNSVNCPQT